MCGIVGVFSFLSDNSGYNISETVSSMLEVLYHRGPDDSGIWTDANKKISLGHRRLSILDLSEAGHQPMFSRSNRYTLSFNGEIYNFLELKSKLEIKNYNFRGGSDTEVILACFDEYGIEESFKKFEGMFAVAVWDSYTNCLVLARDPVGEKPLYYGIFDKQLYFASELKAFRECKSINLEIDRNVICSYLRHNYITSPYSIYKNIYKVNPGEYLVFKISEGLIKKIKYSDFKQKFVIPSQRATKYTFQDSLSELEILITKSIEKRMISDVPIGAFLSGGIDSSLIVSIAAALSSKKLNTFTIGFEDPDFNEAGFAKKVAKYINTNHTELFVSSSDIRDAISKVPKYFDEPFSDSSQIPTLLLSQLTREKVTVALSGDGGDELFYGYNRFVKFNKLSQMIKFTNHIPDSLYSFFKSTKLLKNKTKRQIATLSKKSKMEMYRYLVSHEKNPEDLVINGTEYKTLFDNSYLIGMIERDATDSVAFFDFLTFLPDDILVKVDRATMSVGLEARVPFLDKKIIEFAYELPFEYKYDGLEQKKILKCMLERYLPKDMIYRPKMGFGVPVSKWIRNELKIWSKDLLSIEKIKSEGFFQPKLIDKLLSDHLEYKNDNGYLLWNILMFEIWLDSIG